MDIKISDSWLREFLETPATPQQIGEYLTLCSQSVEKIQKTGNDFVYEIEITSNRPDCFSVQGIARELSTILPRFGISAKLKEPETEKIPQLKSSLPLNVTITNQELCPRFTAIIFDNITIKPSPEFAQKRLIQSGIRALNNVVDISNYLMIELGQPMHTFDYDKILKHKMILREAKEGEEIITLDGQKRILKEGTIVIEDGEGRLVDLCGIMGAKNSETNENTKRVLLFVQTYNPSRIRKACQALSFRTEAASRFEKGLDPEGVIPAIERAIFLFKKWCNATVASNLYDIYPSPRKPKKVSVTLEQIKTILGIDFKIEEASKILSNLGFETQIDSNQKKLNAQVPHWRYDDINIPEDLVEEIARIYGYHQLPSVLPPLTTLDFPRDKRFFWEDRIKTALKYWGFNETASLSLVSQEEILENKPLLKLANPLTQDAVYLRTSLFPSLLKTIVNNPQEEKIQIFEIANVYLPKGKDQLPDEKLKLGIAVSENNFYYLKGIIEALLEDVGIKKCSFEPSNTKNFLIHEAKIKADNQELGIMGVAPQEKITNFNLKKPVALCEIDLESVFSLANENKTYQPIPKYPPIIEDLCFSFPPKTQTGKITEEIYKASDIIKNVSLLDSFEDKKTFRITYQSPKQNLKDEDIKSIREKIISLLESKFTATLKQI